MKYARWFIANFRGIRLNIVARIAAGLLQTVLALLVVWLSKRLIDDVAISGTMGEMAVQALLIAAAVVAGVSIRQLNQQGFYNKGGGTAPHSLFTTLQPTPV